MGGRRFPAEELPSDGVEIGGDDGCEHSYYERIGSDGGTNIYFRCLECSKVVLKYGQAAQREAGERNGADSAADLLTDSGSNADHNSLMKGLSFDSGSSIRPDTPSEGKPDGGKGGRPDVLGRLKSALRGLFGSDEK